MTGWKEADGYFTVSYNDTKDGKYSQKSIPQKWFSGLEVGQILTPSKVSVKDGKTQPPKLNAMTDVEFAELDLIPDFGEGE